MVETFALILSAVCIMALTFIVWLTLRQFDREREAWQEERAKLPDRMGVLHVNNDGEYVLHESPKELVLAAADDAFDWFLAKKQLEKKLNALQRGRERERVAS